MCNGWLFVFFKELGENVFKWVLGERDKVFLIKFMKWLMIY